VPIVLKSGSLNLLEPLGSVQDCTAIALPLALPLPLPIYYYRVQNYLLHFHFQKRLLVYVMRDFVSYFSLLFEINKQMYSIFDALTAVLFMNPQF